ncbi:MAG: hypothetical protein HWN66_06510 [Candidatus Helarchaeota archaeon]|nr:hypothetical protein [Candidatus Helarchaeota archaeon]
MVKILEHTFRHALEGPYVMFDITVKMYFPEDEIGTRWRLETIIVEKDRLSPDDVFSDPNWSRTFSANREIVSLDIHVPLLKRDLNTEPGPEEVYAKLKVVAIEGSFPSGETTTDTVKIDI